MVTHRNKLDVREIVHRYVHVKTFIAPLFRGLQFGETIKFPVWDNEAKDYYDERWGMVLLISGLCKLL